MKQNEIKNLLRKYKIRPSKKLGQNFLISEKAVKKFIKALNLKAKDIVLEIGPGLGTLTEEIAKKAKKVIAVEKDEKMYKIAKERIKEFSNVQIMNKDVLVLQISKLKFQSRKYKIAGNLPFNAAFPIIKKFLKNKNPAEEMIFIIQKEKAQKICALKSRDIPNLKNKDGKIKPNFSSVFVRFYAKPKIISYVPKKSFFPRPKVDSAIIKISRIQKPKRINQALFFKIVKAGFSHSRKQLLNNLSKELNIKKERTEFWLLKSGVRPEQRAETLAVKDWLELTKNFKEPIKRL